jgi:autoinducer 2 (AI-2) kinase
VPGKYVVVVDAGSSGCRSLIIDLKGNLVSLAYQEWAYDVVPPEIAPMGKEFKPGKFWDIICRLIRESIKKADISPVDIIAVSSASQRQGVVFLDKKGHELYAAPNTDLRAIMEGFAIDGEFGDEVYRITGHKPSLLFTPARLKWFQANSPRVYEKIATALSIGDWITYRLSGERVAEVSCVADLGLVDIHEVKWSDTLGERLQLSREVCPMIVTAGTRVGWITSEAVKKTGLSSGTVVVAGGADTQCGLLGMGVKDKGEVGIVVGWSGAIQMVTTRPIIDPKGRLWSGCHALPRRWVLESNAQECGGAYRWLKGLLFSASDQREDIYGLMDSLAQEVPAGAEGMLAFIGPAVMDMSRLKPSLGGFIFPVTPSVTSMERKHFVRAALENLAFAFKGNCAQLEEVSRQKVKEVSIGGGIAQSRCLVKILSDILAMPVTCFESPQVTAWGAAMCAAVGSGVYPDLQRAMVAMRPKSRVVEPDAQSGEEYAGYYERWLTTARWLQDLYEKIG